jgi:hypothetical protein
MLNYLPSDLPRVVGEAAPLIALALTSTDNPDAIAISYHGRGILVQARTQETRHNAVTGLKSIKETFLTAGWGWTARYGSDGKFGMFFTPAWIPTS